MTQSSSYKDYSVGRHLILDAWGVPTRFLNDPQFVRKAMEEAVVACDATLLEICVHHFSPHGVTATAVLAESHIAIHTWPEHGYLGADLFYCGRGAPERAIESLARSFQARELRTRTLARGLGAATNPAGWLGDGEE